MPSSASNTNGKDAPPSSPGWQELELVDPPSRFEPATSIAKESPLFVSYRIDGQSSIPSDGDIHKVSIAELPFEASISHVVVPKIKAVVYLEVRYTHNYH